VFIVQQLIPGMSLQLWDTRFATLAVREAVRLARVVL
jgi:hypothetical protein